MTFLTPNMPVAAAASAGGEGLVMLGIAATFVTLLALAAAFYLGLAVGKLLRLTVGGPVLGLLLMIVPVAAAIWGGIQFANMRMDILGGHVLVYEIDADATRAARELEALEGIPRSDERVSSADRDNLIQNLSRRLATAGVRDASVRGMGHNEIEIVLPGADDQDLAAAQACTTTVGKIRFRILADDLLEGYLIVLADLPDQQNESIVRDAEGRGVAQWLRYDPDEIIIASFNEFKTRIGPHGDPEILVALDPYHIRGEHFAAAWQSFDEDRATPCVSFTMTAEGAGRLGGLTGDNLPDGTHYRHLAIVLDDFVLTAPRIQSRITREGQITGNFTDANAALLASLFDSGPLPAVLRSKPVSAVNISPTISMAAMLGYTIAAGSTLVLLLAALAFYFHWPESKREEVIVAEPVPATAAASRGDYDPRPNFHRST